jgi:hypothetical protein
MLLLLSQCIQLFSRPNVVRSHRSITVGSEGLRQHDGGTNPELFETGLSIYDIALHYAIGNIHSYLRHFSFTKSHSTFDTSQEQTTRNQFHDFVTSQDYTVRRSHLFIMVSPCLVFQGQQQYQPQPSLFLKSPTSSPCSSPPAARSDTSRRAASPA